MITINMMKARDVLRDQLRAQRTPLLEEADINFMKALESGADTTPIVALKQKLRNLPEDPRIDQANTVEELKMLTMEVLLNAV